MNENAFENCNKAINTATNTVLSTSRGWGAHKSQGDLPWATYRAVVRRQNPVVGLAVQSLKRLCSGYDAIDNAFYIAQAWASNMLRAQGRHVRIKIDDNASPRFAAVRPGVALGDLVIDPPSPQTTPDLVRHRTNLFHHLSTTPLNGHDIRIPSKTTQPRAL
ncbi:hypothetical protein D6C76_08063 [Aureobasidium pullulans]|nr:hypothetical protein D6C76_08063 [Aureobasidium pullulans]